MDDFFNQDVHDWIYGSMSRMDNDEAEMFGRFFVYEVHKQDIENNRRTLDRHIEDVQKSILDDLHPEVRELVTKALVSKDAWNPATNWEEEHHRPQPRDESGRWSRISVNIERGKKPKSKSGPYYRDDRINVNTRQRQAAGKPGFDLSSALATADKEGRAFTDRWTQTGSRDASTNERTYRRIEAGAKLLRNIPNPNVQAAANVAAFAGEFGPEAEKVIGPAARKTAYRYRGTERNPDPKLFEVHDRYLEHLATRDPRVKSTADISPEMRMTAGETTAVEYLKTRLPSKKLAKLQVESGKLPPSEGVIINRDGDIVTQAVGFNEDHYLPFNLKNLKGLQGGSYVRTRSNGGLTSEDIYTGLIAGARSVTVVSHSGTFTIDFDDDLRGGRRYSDKARQMVSRYAQTLDAVQSERVPKRSLSNDERADIREEVEAEWGDMLPKLQVEEKIRAKENDYAAKPRLTEREVAAIERRAVEEARNFDPAANAQIKDKADRLPDDPQKRILALKSRFMENAMEDKANRMYQLDSEGYQVAMDALKEQFPYFIQDARWRPNASKDEHVTGLRTKDTGYVRPGYNRPKAVQAGYFDEEINGKGKFPASELANQNYRGRKAGEVTGSSRERTETAETEGAEAEQQGQAATPAAPSAKETQERMVHETTRKAAATDAAKVAIPIAAAIRRDASDDSLFPMIERFRKENGLETFSSADVTKLLEESREVFSELDTEDNKKNNPVAHSKMKMALDIADEAESRVNSQKTFSEADWDLSAPVSKYPQKFSNAREHTPNQEPEVYQKAWEHVMSRGKEMSPESAQLRDNPSDEKLRDMQSKYQRLYTALQDADKNDSASLVRMQEAVIRVTGDAKRAAALTDEVVTNGSDALAPVAEMARAKAKQYMEARSILAASGGKLNQPAKTAADSNVVQSHVVSPDMKAVPTQGQIGSGSKAGPTPGTKTRGEELDELLYSIEEKAAKYTDSDTAVGRGVEEMMTALSVGTDEDVEDALTNLPPQIQNEFKDYVRGYLKLSRDRRSS